MLRCTPADCDKVVADTSAALLKINIRKKIKNKAKDTYTDNDKDEFEKTR